MARDIYHGAMTDAPFRADTGVVVDHGPHEFFGMQVQAALCIDCTIGNPPMSMPWCVASINQAQVRIVRARAGLARDGTPDRHAA
jgi:hypothetical protein